MPSIDNAIQGKISKERKIYKARKLAQASIPKLPEWMFWNEEQMDTYIDKIENLEEAKMMFKEVGQFVRIMVRLHGEHEEQD